MPVLPIAHCWVQVATGVCQTTIRAAVRDFWTEQLHGRWFQCEEVLQVFTSACLASLALEAGAAAAERGRVTPKELASIFKLPVEVRVSRCPWYQSGWSVGRRVHRATSTTGIAVKVERGGMSCLYRWWES